jgi:hypothetical protein
MSHGSTVKHIFEVTATPSSLIMVAKNAISDELTIHQDAIAIKDDQPGIRHSRRARSANVSSLGRQITASNRAR